MKSRILGCLLLALTGANLCAASGRRQGFYPYGIALTEDGRYAYLSFNVSPIIAKVRLGDMTVVATSDLSRYAPLDVQQIVLDATGARLFLLDGIQCRLLAFDAGTLEEVKVIDGFRPGQLIRSRWGPYLILASGLVWMIHTESLEVTEILKPVGITFVRESAIDPEVWYSVAPQSTGATIGLFNYKSKQWTPKATVAPASGNLPVFDFEVMPDGGKAYLAVFSGWLPNYQAEGYIYAADLRSGAVKEVRVDGGALTLAFGRDARKLYVGVGWPAFNQGSGRLILVADTGTDTIQDAVSVGPTKFGWKCAQTNDLALDPVTGQLLYSTNSDGNSFVKVDLTTNRVTDILVLNEETNSPLSFVPIPGSSRAYVLLSRSNEVLDVDLNAGQVMRTTELPQVRSDSRGGGALFRDPDTLLVAQGESFVELGGDLRFRARRNLPAGSPSVWNAIGSRDGRTVYSVSQPRGTESVYQPNTLLAIDSTSFQVRASLRVDGGSFNLPWEHPTAGKLYLAGGEEYVSVTVHVVDAATHSLRKSIRFDDPGLAGISAGPYYPYAYDASRQTLFVATTWAILAIDTGSDEITRVIRLDEITTARGLQRHMLPILNPIGLFFHPAQNRLYLAHLDGSLISVYDLAKSQFLPQLTPLLGYFPGWVLASDDGSKVWTANRRSDSLTVLDTRTGQVERVIDLHSCHPSPTTLQFETGTTNSRTVTLSSLTTTGPCRVSTSAGWLSATSAGSTSATSLDVGVDPTVFGPGVYRGTVTLESASGAQSTVTVGLKAGSGQSSVQVAAAADGAGFGPVVAPGAWAFVTGGNLAPATRIWRPEEIVEGILPSAVEGTSVTVNGRSAAVYAVSPTQINFQVPGGVTDGPASVQVSNNGALSNTLSVAVRQRAPELFRFLPSNYVVALHADYRIAAKPDLFPGCVDVTLCPPSEAAPGETILLYATGLGPTVPGSPAGRVISAPVPLSTPVEVRFGANSVIAPAWIVGAGLYQINVRVPESTAEGDVPLVIAVADSTSTAKVQLSIKRAR